MSRQFYPQIMILPFLSQKFTHDWQVNSICCKSSLYEQAKEFNDFRFYYFPFKPEKNTNKIYAFLNHFSIYMQVSDLYFMVQWFCLISWRLFDGQLSELEYWIYVMQIYHIKCIWVSDLHFMVQWFCLISWRLWWRNVVLKILIQCDIKFDLQIYM